MNVIDLDKLENKFNQPDGTIISACPQCRLENRDKAGKHLKIWPNAAFHCILDGSKEHNHGILKLVGTESDEMAAQYISAPPEPKIKQLTTWPLTILDKLIFDYSYFESRGISAKTQKCFRIGVASSGQLNGRAIIPIFSSQKDKIIGFTGRLINYTKWHKENKIARWKHLNPASSFLFCGDEESIKSSRTIIIVEGPADILALYEIGIKNTICLFGVNISSKQLAFLIKNNPKKIIISLNNEKSNVGNLASEKLKSMLDKYFNEDSVIIGLPTLKDFCEMLETDRNSLDQWREKWLNG